jgi:quercetin dioxygenase-like cupin family protein
MSVASVIPLAAAPKYHLVGDVYTLLLSGEQTGGRFALIHSVVSPGFGPPPHLHENEDETFYILSGEVAYFVDGKEHRTVAGTAVHVPRNVPHYFRNQGTVPAAFLVEVHPAGNFDQYLKTVGTPLPADYVAPAVSAPPTPEHIAKVMAHGPQFGIRFL